MMETSLKPLLAGETEQSLLLFLKEHGQPSFRAKQILDWFWNKRVDSFDAMRNLPKDLKESLASRFSLEPLEVLEINGREGETRKFLSTLRDGQCVESVIIPAARNREGGRSGRVTLCVSSQVGCAFGCRFCASGLLGFTRNLDAGEIVSQILAAEKIAGARVDNVVFMGMGEPLANYDNLLRALDVITSPLQLNIGSRHITISTSGHVPHLVKLAGYPKQIRLAVSLHGATDETRNRIMPVNKKWPLAELREALRQWASTRKQLVTLEYILIHHVNDSMEDAEHLVRFSKNLPVKVNLIPYNTVEGLEWERPPLSQCSRFLEQLTRAGIPATMRYEKGHNIDAACGQLRLRRAKGGDDRAS